MFRSLVTNLSLVVVEIDLDGFFDVFCVLGAENFITSSIGRAWQIFNVLVVFFFFQMSYFPLPCPTLKADKLRIVMIGPQFAQRMSAIATRKDFTFSGRKTSLPRIWVFWNLTYLLCSTRKKYFCLQTHGEGSHSRRALSRHPCTAHRGRLLFAVRGQGVVPFNYIISMLLEICLHFTRGGWCFTGIWALKMVCSVCWLFVLIVTFHNLI